MPTPSAEKDFPKTHLMPETLGEKDFPKTHLMPETLEEKDISKELLWCLTLSNIFQVTYCRNFFAFVFFHLLEINAQTTDTLLREKTKTTSWDSGKNPFLGKDLGIFSWFLKNVFLWKMSGMKRISTLEKPCLMKSPRHQARCFYLDNPFSQGKRFLRKLWKTCSLRTIQNKHASIIFAA